MSSKENYFPNNTDISVVNDIIYTDYMFLAHTGVLPDDLNSSECVSETDAENTYEPPF